MVGKQIAVLSMWQPWASLLLAGVKLHETRSYATPQTLLDQRVIIYATKKFPKKDRYSEELHQLCVEVFGKHYRKELPTGALLGTVKISACYPTEQSAPVTPQDGICGDWTPGRYAWYTKNPRRLKKPRAATATSQGVWYYTFGED